MNTEKSDKVQPNGQMYNSDGEKQLNQESDASNVYYPNLSVGLTTKTIVGVVTVSVLLITAILGTMFFLILKKGNPKKPDSTIVTTEYAEEQSVKSNDTENAGNRNQEDIRSVTPAETVKMPECANMTVEDIRSQLAAYGLKVSLEYAFDEDIPKDCVISQSIPANADVTTDETVVLTVSKGSDICPYDYSQKLVVTSFSGSSKGTAALYEWIDGDWTLQVAYECAVGQNGISPAKEGGKITPEGLHHLGVVLSSNTVETNMIKYTVTSKTCVVDDEKSPLYNQIMEKDRVPSGTSYDNIGEGMTNGSTYATIYIEHNGTGFSSENVVNGKGSAIGLRGRNSTLSPTYGDVDISSDDMKDLLKRLDYNQNPMIEITVG